MSNMNIFKHFELNLIPEVKLYYKNYAENLIRNLGSNLANDIFSYKNSIQTYINGLISEPRTVIAYFEKNFNRSYVIGVIPLVITTIEASVNVGYHHGLEFARGVDHE